MLNIILPFAATGTEDVCFEKVNMTYLTVPRSETVGNFRR